MLTVVSLSCKHDAGRKVSIQPLLFCNPVYPLILLLQAAMSCAGLYKLKVQLVISNVGLSSCAS